MVTHIRSSVAVTDYCSHPWDTWLFLLPWQANSNPHNTSQNKSSTPKINACPINWKKSTFCCKSRNFSQSKKHNMKREDQQNATIRCLILTSVSTCFGHHYAHLQENKGPVTAFGVLFTIVLTSYKTAPHNRYQPHPAELEQHTKCSNRAFVLLEMGIMMPETCWDRS